MNTIDEFLVHRALSRTPAPDLARQLAKAAEVDTRTAASLAAMSYEHANGFAKLVISSAGVSGTKVRVHYWRDTQQFGAIHDHSFDFASVVLFGSLCEETFALTPSFNALTLLDLPNLFSKRNGAVPQIREEMAALKLLETRTLTTGAYRIFPAGLLHRVKSLAPTGTATICHQSAHSKSSSVVVTSDLDMGRRAFEKQYFSVSEYRDTLHSISLKALNSPSPVGIDT